MCGRFSAADPARIAARYSRYQFPDGFAASYNIAPTQRVAALCNDSVPNVALLHWGLLPPWSKDKSLAYKTINARSETAAEKPMFRNAFRKRRCVIFADSYFEWKKTEEGKKQPYRFLVDDGAPIAFAGLWESREDAVGEMRSCSILTTQPNEVQSPYHDRMPVILDDDAMNLWLTSDDVPADLLRTALRPFDASRMSVHAVSPLLNNVRNNSADCIAPVEDSPLPLLDAVSLQ